MFWTVLGLASLIVNTLALVGMLYPVSRMERVLHFVGALSGLSMVLN